VALVGLAVYFSGSLGLKFPFIAPAKFAPSMFTSDRDCSDFASRWQAQLFYWQAGFGDPHRLDEDGDGFVCEFKPMFSFR
jgi:micrococcal nuclease